MIRRRRRNIAFKEVMCVNEMIESEMKNNESTTMYINHLNGSYTNRWQTLN